MKRDKKKLAAAIAAVYAHLSTTEQAHAPAASDSALDMAAQAAATMVSGPQPNFWGMSGRQAQMQANTMMQLRAFK